MRITPDRAKQFDLAAILVLLTVAGTLYLSRLDAGTISIWDEGTYAEIAASLLKTGDLFQLRSNGQLWPEKPPLWIWTLALSIKLLGMNSLAIRLPSALWSLVLPLACYYPLRSWIGRLPALLAALLVIVFPINVDLGRRGMIDIPLLVCFAVAVFAAWGADRQPRRWLLCGLALALAILLKGPAALLIPVVIAWAWVATGRPWPFHTRWLPLALLLVVVLVAPWYVHQTWSHGVRFWQLHLGQQLMDRAAGGLGHGNDPAGLGDWFYPRWIMKSGGLLCPWAGIALVAVISVLLPGWRRLWREREAATWTLIWLAVPLLAATGMAFKNLQYVVPATVPLAVLMAIWVHAIWRRINGPQVVLFALAAGLTNLQLEVPLLLVTKSPFFNGMLLSLTAGIPALCLYRRRHFRPALQIMRVGVIALVGFCVGYNAHLPAVRDGNPGLAELQAFLARYQQPDTTCLSWNCGDIGPLFFEPVGFVPMSTPEKLAYALNWQPGTLAILPADQLVTLQPMQAPGCPWRLLALGNSFNSAFAAISNTKLRAEDNAIYLPAGSADRQLGLLARLSTVPLPRSSAPLAQLGDCLELFTASFQPKMCEPGALVECRLVWRVYQPSAHPLKLKLRIQGMDSGCDLATRTVQPIYGAVDTSTMPTDSWITETFMLRIPFETTPGIYPVSVAVADPPGNQQETIIGRLQVQ